MKNHITQGMVDALVGATADVRQHHFLCDAIKTPVAAEILRDTVVFIPERELSARVCYSANVDFHIGFAIGARWDVMLRSIEILKSKNSSMMESYGIAAYSDFFIRPVRHNLDGVELDISRNDQRFGFESFLIV